MNAGDARRQLRKANDEPLHAKADRAREVIRLTIEHAGEGTMVSYSGGRDSTAMALLALEQYPEIKLVYQDTGIADPRLLDFITTWAGRNLERIPPACDPFETWKWNGCLPIGAKVSADAYRRANPEIRVNPSRCCRRHKAEPMNAWLRENGCLALIVGARGDDSLRHAFKLMYGEIINSPHGWLLAYPLFTWEQGDTIEFLRQRMPDYPLAYARNEELGCRACAINMTRHPNQMSKVRQSDPAYHRRLMVEAGYGLEILMIAHGLTRAGAEALVEKTGWDRLINEGHLDHIPQPRQGLR